MPPVARAQVAASNAPKTSHPPSVAANLQAMVRITGTSRDDLNGLLGTTTDYDEAKERYTVVLENNKQLALKLVNLEIVRTHADMQAQAALALASELEAKKAKKQKKKLQKQMKKLAGKAVLDQEEVGQEEAEEEEEQAASVVSAFGLLEDSEEEDEEDEQEEDSTEDQRAPQKAANKNRRNAKKKKQKQKQKQQNLKTNDSQSDDFDFSDFSDLVDTPSSVSPPLQPETAPEAEPEPARTTLSQEGEESLKQELNVEQLAQLMKSLKAEKQQARKAKSAQDKVTEKIMFGAEQEVQRISDLSDRSHVVLDYRKQGLQNGGGGVACGRSSHTAGEKKRIKP